MKIRNSQFAGWSLMGFGSGFFALVLFEVDQHGWDPKALTTYLAMLTSCLLVLTGLSYLMPNLFVDVVPRLLVWRAIITGHGEMDVAKLRRGLGLAFQTKDEVDAEAKRHTSVPGIKDPPPLPDEWNRLVRPVLHQASQYMAPTYYLNRHLQVIDWNLGFDLIFQEIIGELRGQHVNQFIARLRNSRDVFKHASEFPDKIERQPQVDTERLVYKTRDYGVVEFEKIATKLHDLQGQQQGWAVTLLIRQLESDSWDKLIRDLAARVTEDKFWSIYSVSYDRVLNSYPGYEQLLRNVVRQVPEGALRVVDLGAGTGNPSRLLLEGNRRRSVWAVEKNMAMLDLLRRKDWVAAEGDRFKIVKSSVENLEMLAGEDPFDAAIAVNVLYAVDDVPRCLANLNQIMQMGATFVFSTTDSETRLGPLLDEIEASLKHSADWKETASHFDRVKTQNMKLEAEGRTTRYTRDQYCTWLEKAGFEVEIDRQRHYMGALIIGRATKNAEVAATAPPVPDLGKPPSSSPVPTNNVVEVETTGS
jgi:SAM-dependent methyltransferase